MAAVPLQERGWYMSEEGISQCTVDGKSDIESIVKVALNTDLREIGKGWLPDDLNRGKAEYVQGPGVLQLQKLRNISAPKDNEESQFAPRLMKLVLTDGHMTCSAVETEVLKDIGPNTAPGTKILLKLTTAVEHGFLLLNNKNTKNLGGRVEKLAESWELKKKLAKQQRSTFGTDGGPPPFVPFGQKIGNDAYKPTRRDNFKSLDANKGEKKTEDKEFEQQRQATIAEALQAKEDGQSKKFGGGQKQISSDHDIAKITEMGFKTEEATVALKQNNGDVQKAIESLLSGGGTYRPQGGPGRPGTFDSGDRRGAGGPNRQSSYESDKGRGRRDRRDDETGPRGRHGRNEEVDTEVNSKPSAPATLFDFLAISNKLPETKEKPDKTNTGKNADFPKSNIESHERSRNTSGGSDRAKHNVPPRFVNKSKAEQNRVQGQGRFQDNNSDRPQRSRDDRPNTAPADSRKFENRNQGERSRNYNEKDRNFSDRNRNLNDKDRNQGARNFSDKDRNNYNRSRNFNDKDRNYNDRDKNFNDRSKTFNDRNYNDNRAGGGKGEDRHFKQVGGRNDGFNSKSDSDISQKQNDDRRSAKDTRKPDSARNRAQAQVVNEKTLRENIVNKSSSSVKTSVNNNRDQGQSQNLQGQSRSSQPPSEVINKQQSASSYKQKETYSGVQNSLPNYNNVPNNSQTYTVSNNFVPTPAPVSSYGGFNSYPTMSTTGQFQQAEYVYTEAQAPIHFSIKAGDKVMAKYWEDNLFYEAVIEQMTPNLATVIVRFVEYGNVEEVYIADLRPYIPQLMAHQPPMIPADMSVPPPQVYYSAPPPVVPTTMDQVIQSISSMEFRRGGGGATYQRKDPRSQQQYYQPPAQRK